MKMIASQAIKTPATARLARRFRSKSCSLKSEIKDSLAKGLISFYIDAFSKPDAASMGIAYGEAKLALINPLNFNKVEIISPSPAMYATYGINSPTGRYIPNDNLEYRDANPRTSADGQISIRDANILKIKVTYAYDIDKVPLMATLLRRVMCTGFVDKSSVDAWSPSNLQGYDIPSCAYYMRKKLPIVAYATVQMQSNAIQVAGAASPASPTSPPVTPTPAPSTPTTPLQPYPEPPITPVTPAPVVPTPTQPSQPVDPIPTDPNTPVACTTPQPSPAVMMGAITPQQAQQQQRGNEKMIAMAGPALPLVCVINPGVCVATAAGIIRVCTTAVSVIRQLIVAGVAYETYNCAVNGSCSVPAPTAESLTAGHIAAAGDRAQPGYGGRCTPDEHDKRRDYKNSSCNGKKDCSPTDSKEIVLSKKADLQQCFDARKDMMDTCFMGGDNAHKTEMEKVRRSINTCNGLGF
jgi:hypothetical protein